MNPQISSTSICSQVKLAHLFVHDLLAGYADAKPQAHNRVSVDAGDALNRPDADALTSMEITATFFSVFRMFAINCSTFSQFLL